MDDGTIEHYCNFLSVIDLNTLNDKRVYYVPNIAGLDQPQYVDIFLILEPIEQLKKCATVYLEEGSNKFIVIYYPIILEKDASNALELRRIKFIHEFLHFVVILHLQSLQSKSDLIAATSQSIDEAAVIQALEVVSKATKQYVEFKKRHVDSDEDVDDYFGLANNEHYQAPQVNDIGGINIPLVFRRLLLSRTIIIGAIHKAKPARPRDVLDIMLGVSAKHHVKLHYVVQRFFEEREQWSDLSKVLFSPVQKPKTSSGRTSPKPRR